MIDVNPEQRQAVAHGEPVRIIDPFTHDVAGARPPFRLRMAKGIAVHNRDAVPPGPRLPLLGIPALLNNDLDLLARP
jgi:hypothetical protein